MLQKNKRGYLITRHQKIEKPLSAVEKTCQSLNSSRGQLDTFYTQPAYYIYTAMLFYTLSVKYYYSAPTFQY